MEAFAPVIRITKWSPSSYLHKILPYTKASALPYRTCFFSWHSTHKRMPRERPLLNIIHRKNTKHFLSHGLKYASNHIIYTTGSHFTVRKTSKAPAIQKTWYTDVKPGYQDLFNHLRYLDGLPYYSFNFITRIPRIFLLLITFT